MNTKISVVQITTAMILGGLGIVPAFSQDFVTLQDNDDSVQINCPESVDLEILVDYVGKTLGVHFLYGEELQNKRVELRPSPIIIPKSHLLQLLSSLLRIKDLALIEEGSGLYRILVLENVTRSVSEILPEDSAADRGSMRVVTQVLTVPSGQVQDLADKLTGFLTSPRSGLVSVPARGLLIVTDYEHRVHLLQHLVGLLTSSPVQVEIGEIVLQSSDPQTVAEQLTAILAETNRLTGSDRPAAVVRGDIQPNALIVIGEPHQIQEARALAAQLVPQQVELETATYRPRFMSIRRLKSLIQNTLVGPGSTLRAPARVYADPAGGRLYVTATPEMQQAIAATLADEDSPVPETERPLRIYRPEHRKASELLGTLSLLLSEAPQIAANDESGASSRSSPGPTHPPSRPGSRQVPPVPPAQGASGVPGSTRQTRRITGSGYVIAEDEHTNSILAIGTREFHGQLEALIDDLDRRRPQVLIEMTLVAITTSDSMDLGIELAKFDLGGVGWDYLLFSNFGLSSIDVSSGQRMLIPGIGGNGVVLRPGEFSAVIRALATSGIARVVSTPKLLVSDNARGVLRNVDEAPFTSVNASDTVATTSFAGFESAGTTLSITPHISEGDHLTLEYELSFSNFTGSSSEASIPPPRTTNSFTSVVEIPDGNVVVTGGLVVKNSSDTESRIPFAGDIPLLGELFKTTSRQNTLTKVYAFIRPSILREDDLEQLKYISLKSMEDAEVLKEDVIPEMDMWMK